MFAMVTVEIAAEFLYAFTISRHDVPGLANVHRILEQARAGIISVIALVSGVVFGLLTAFTIGFDFFEGWLIAAYVLVGLFLVTSTINLRGVLPLGRKAVEAASGGRPAEDVVRDMAGTRALRWFVVDLAIVVAIIVDMVIKPF
jgi:hypothetical protein